MRSAWCVMVLVPQRIVVPVVFYTARAAHLRYARNGVSLYPCVASLLAI